MVRELGGGRGGRSGGRSIGGLARQKHADALVFDHVHVLIFSEKVIKFLLGVLVRRQGRVGARLRNVTQVIF